jgi:hypothetical protein
MLAKRRSALEHEESNLTKTRGLRGEKEREEGSPHATEKEYPQNVN